MLDEKSPVALYYQLKEVFIDKIKTGVWQIDKKIPTERQLCEMYNVSRITVRQALNELEKEGLLYRKQGKGTFVTAPKIEQRLSKFYSFSDEIRKMGLIPSTSILDFRIVKSDENISQFLNIAEGMLVYSIKRIRLANNEPFAIETSYIPCDICPDLAESEVASKGLYNTMRSKYGIFPDEAEETFEAIIISNEDASHLRINKNSPGLHLDRFTYANGRPVEYCKSIICGDRYKYRVTLKLSKGEDS